MRTLVQQALAVIAVMLVVVSCSRTDAAVTQSSSGQGAGTLISVEDLHDIDPEITAHAAKAVRVTYRSTSGPADDTTTVTGAAFIPMGRPPIGGWPIVALAHGSTGIDGSCAPSNSPDLLGNAAAVAALLQYGNAVVVADYQGLGGPGGHPYLDARTAGLNIIDSVRALRALSPDVSDRWAAYGASQGGAAAWAANEQSGSRATELRLLGTVSIAPAADVSEFASLAAQKALNPSQLAAYVWLLGGLAKTQPDFDLEKYRHDIPADIWESLLTCDRDRAVARQRALATIKPEQVQPRDSEAQERLRSLLTSWALPQGRAAAPMLVVFGGRDEYIRPKWTEDAIARACGMGSRVAAILQPDRGHDDLDAGAAMRWLADRFNGDPAPTTC